MDRSCVTSWSFVFCVILQISTIHCGGKVEVRLNSFVNPDGEGANGHCCDGRSIFCFGECDHLFILCLDDRYGVTAASQRTYKSPSYLILTNNKESPLVYEKLFILVLRKWNDSFWSRCEQDINECSESPCKNNGTCNNYIGGFNCACAVQWTGLDCTEEVDFCEDNLCQNSACVAFGTTYSCSCNSGWTGKFCDVNIDECQNNPCQNNAKCVDNAGSFICTCIEGFHGRYCETNKDECSSLPCMNSGTCTDLINDFQCQCSSGFTGTLCENDVDECTSSPCKHGSTCENHDGGFNCRCVNGTVGDLCEGNINECESNGCQNGGTCIDRIGMFECACDDEFTGKLCEKANPTETHWYAIGIIIAAVVVFAAVLVILRTVKHYRKSRTTFGSAQSRATQGDRNFDGFGNVNVVYDYAQSPCVESTEYKLASDDTEHYYSKID